MALIVKIFNSYRFWDILGIVCLVMSVVAPMSMDYIYKTEICIAVWLGWLFVWFIAYCLRESCKVKE